MDPASAFGLAAGVVQFVQFASTLLSKTSDNYKSVGGVSTRIKDLDALYTELSSLSASLQQHSGPPSASSSSSSTTLNQLASSCKADCDELLVIVGKLKCEQGSRSVLKSFKTALKEMRKQDAIVRLRDNIHQRRGDMVLAICTISNQSIQTLQTELEVSKRASAQLANSHANRLEAIEIGIAKVVQQNEQFSSNIRNSTNQDQKMLELIGNLESLSLSSRDATESLKREKILESLRHDEAPVRHANIPEAHETTFKWTLQDPNQTQGEATARISKQGNVLHWLRKQNGIFWVSGKPGSGKSTFMKFVADHTNTMAALTSWASPLPVTIASHYFWSMGTQVQRSQQGLWQSLLYQVLERQSSEGFRTACPDRWHDKVVNAAPWSPSELQQSLKRIMEQQKSVRRFCFFIDGLDEFDGDFLDLVQALARLCESPAIKMCLASRPENAFENTLGHSAVSKIGLHHLTREDILEFTTSRLTGHPRWATAVNKEDGTSLITAITDRAQGVFLWVSLVTNLLREGLTNYDTLADLLRVLDSLPDDLERLFMRMLESVDNRYHEKMAGFLEITLAAHEPLGFYLYHFHEYEYDDPDSALKTRNRSRGIPRPPQSDDFFKEESSGIHVRVQRRINALCKGLLEISYGSSVQFIHRSVGDWLQTPAMRTFVRTKLKPAFDARLSILRAYLMHHKDLGWIPEDQDKDNTSILLNFLEVQKRLDEVLQYAQDDDFDPTFPRDQVYPILDRFSMANWKTLDLSSFDKIPLNIRDRSVAVFRRACAIAGLWSYLSTKCHEDIHFLHGALLFSGIRDWNLIQVSYPAKRKRTPQRDLDYYTSVGRREETDYWDFVTHARGNGQKRDVIPKLDAIFHPNRDEWAFEPVGESALAVQERKLTPKRDSGRRNVAASVLSNLVRHVLHVTTSQMIMHYGIAEIPYRMIFDLYHLSGANPITTVTLDSETSLQMGNALVVILLYYAVQDNIEDTDTNEIHDALASFLKETNTAELLQEHQSWGTPWDIICRSVRARDKKPELRPLALDNAALELEPTIKLARVVVEALMNNARGIKPDSWMELAAATVEAFLRKDSTELIDEMTSLGLFDEIENRGQKRHAGELEHTQPEKRPRALEILESEGGGEDEAVA